jgi:hypothetical protein
MVIKMRFAGLVAAVAAFGLSGCGGGLPGIGGLGGSSSAGADVPAQQPGQYQQSPFFARGVDIRNIPAPGSVEADEPIRTCPTVGVLEGGSAYRGGSAPGSAQGVAYQASLINRARECSFEGGQLRMRVGVEGRLLLGTSGRAGSYSVPVRVVVKRRNDIVAQRSARVSVTIPGNDTQTEFAHIEENIVLPLSQNDPGDEFDVFVGFDGTVARPQRQARRR